MSHSAEQFITIASAATENYTMMSRPEENNIPSADHPPIASKAAAAGNSTVMSRPEENNISSADHSPIASKAAVAGDSTVMSRPEENNVSSADHPPIASKAAAAGNSTVMSRPEENNISAADYPPIASKAAAAGDSTVMSRPEENNVSSADHPPIASKAAAAGNSTVMSRPEENNISAADYPPIASKAAAAGDSTVMSRPEENNIPSADHPPIASKAAVADNSTMMTRIAEKKIPSAADVEQMLISPAEKITPTVSIAAHYSTMPIRRYEKNICGYPFANHPPSTSKAAAANFDKMMTHPVEQNNASSDHPSTDSTAEIQQMLICPAEEITPTASVAANCSTMPTRSDGKNICGIPSADHLPSTSKAAVADFKKMMASSAEQNASADHPPIASTSDIQVPDNLVPEVIIKGRDAWQVLCSLRADEINAYIKNLEFGFRFKTENIPNKGKMRYYECSRIKARCKPQCARKVLVFIPNNQHDVVVSARGSHSCSNAPTDHLARTPLAADDQHFIEAMLKAGHPTRDVKAGVKARNPKISNNQLGYAVKITKVNMFGNGELSLGELETWTRTMLTPPEDDRKGFVVGKDIDHENGRFRIVVSSKKLLSLLGRFSVVAADCTFKVTLQGHPLLVVCVIDAMRHAHPVAFAIISNQEQTDYDFVFAAIFNRCASLGLNCQVQVFMSDGEMALKNAARAIFGGEVVLLNCYFHVMQNVTKHLKKSVEIPKEAHDQIRKDLALLQVAPTKQHFAAAGKMFLQKYGCYPLFLNFFEKYLQNPKLLMWYEAAAPGIPATNNALEALNKSLKDKLRRQKEPLGTFKSRLLEIVFEYGDPERTIVCERIFDLETERKTYDWLKTSKKVRTVNCQETLKCFTYIPGKEVNDITSQDIVSFEQPKLDSFEKFAADFGKLHRVESSNAEKGNTVMH
nr:uncharacterized protein LOC115254029 [Aedes albopictus]